jgi:ATP-dependent protease ClpP protease subunit
MKSWYELKAKADSVDLYIYDEIGMWGIRASDLIGELRGLKGKALNVYINSPGGDIADGIAIYNALGRHEGAVNVTVDSLAASIASVIAQAGQKRTMAQSATMMIHEPQGLAMGDPATMDKMGDVLNLLGDQIAGIYAGRAGGSADYWRQKMRDETWYKADDAVVAGLADEALGTRSNAYAGRMFNLSNYTKVPDWVNQSNDDPPAEPGSPEPSPKEDTMTMDEQAIRQALGLDETADPVAAIEALRMRAETAEVTLKADAPDKGEAAQLRAQLDEAHERILGSDNEHKGEIIQLRERMLQMEATARVEAAIAHGRITPANRALALEWALGKSEDEFNRFIASLPKVPMGELGTAGSFENEQYEPTAEEIAAAKQLGIWNDDNPAESRNALMRTKGAKIPAVK